MGSATTTQNVARGVKILGDRCELIEIVLRAGAAAIFSRKSQLAGTFNEMLEHLEESFERISRFAADIAHDLRTPVNNIRVEAEVALARPRSAGEYREVLESSLEAIRLSDLIGDLLFLARADTRGWQAGNRELAFKFLEIGENLRREWIDRRTESVCPPAKRHP